MSDNQRYNLKQLFSYIRALTEQRYGLVERWSDYSFNLPLYAVPEHELTDKPSFRESADEPMTDLILSVGKAEVPPCPELPRSLIGWMERGWDDPTKKAEPVDKHEFPAPEDTTVTKTELFSDSALRISDLETWRAQREQWVTEALPAYNVRRVYDRLYELHSELEREKDRLGLMIGDGIFETELEDGTKICHPLVLERVSLVFNANVPCFTISDSDASPMLYSKLLRAIPGLECACLSDYAARIERELIHPFEVARFDELMTSFCNEISSDCEFIAEERKTSARFTVRRGAVLFTRLRASGYSAMLDKIIDDIDVSPELSPSLLSIIGENVDADAAEVIVGGDAMEVNGIAADVLLEKSANREQLLIAKKIAANSAVLVQGPPGTGKTHTISNIIGDLLARGQSVLVSSQTSKALDVLRDKISEPIRPLCVSVLDDNRRQLEESLQKINECMTTDNPESLALEAERIAKERDSVIEDLAAAKRELVELVELEYKPISTGEEEYSPKQAAQLLAAGGEDFIPDSVPAGTRLPLYEAEFKNLYATNTSITAHEEALLTSGAPQTADLLPPKEFARRCAIVLDTNEHLTADGLDYWRADVPRDASRLNDIAAELRRQGEALSGAEEWKLRLAQSGVVGTPGGGLFEKIDGAVAELRALAAGLQLELADTHPSIPEELISEETDAILREMYEELNAEKINWLTVGLRPKWLMLMERCIINGEKCDTRTELYTVMRYHHLLLGRKNLKNRWHSAVEVIGGPALTGDAPEEQAALAWPIVSHWARWYPAVWQPMAAQLAELGFNMDRFLEQLPMEVRMEGEVKTIRRALEQGMADVVQGEYLRGDRSECLEQLDAMEKALLPFTEDYPEIKNLRACIVSRDSAGYPDAFDAYDRVCMKRESYVHRTELLDKLQAVCPLLAAQIRRREGVNGGGEIPGDLAAQWLRCQLRGELELRGRVAVADVQQRIEKLTGRLSGLTRDLIAKRAWSAQLNTMRDSSKRRALTEWAELVKRIGKGTGKRAEQLLASGNLRTAMKNCRRAVPVWIMPISSVAEFFEPSDEKFDVLIIDEASQADLTALIALYIARKVIVVGDDKQVSPTPIGMDVETTAKLRQEFLSNIPSSSMYDELVSVYDLGKANYEPITLKEHFRCADDIINFSNYYTYNGIIRPLRDSGSIKLRPATVACRVEDGAASGRKTNRREAQFTAAIIKACTEMSEYKKSTFGVITMLGDEQAVVIDRILRARLTEAEYQKRRILCGNPSYFQGDERDVILISLVDSSKGDGKTLAIRREGYNEMYAKRYNVAASRAKDQMWVVHSLDPDNDLKSDDIRLKLIRHAADPESTAKALYKHTPTELNDMEAAVSAHLSALGYTMTSRRMVGNYTVALTCEGEGGRVAIECDGDGKYDRDIIVDELNKQSVLERLGWRFLRLRASEYYRDPAAFLEKLTGMLRELAIKPGSGSAKTENLVEKVIARAKELVAEWDAESSPAEALPEEAEELSADGSEETSAEEQSAEQ